ncbi:MAG TPA: twin-arginine translocase subunit TatC [Solirubrobacteraceae bacterium]|nr:twin-arginine translocase subunit TatC [Solirubrobacteraceae bacterium]
MPAIRPIGHEDRLSIVDHLDELRSRLILIIIFFCVAFAFCYAENGAILHIVNKPFADAQNSSANKSSQQQTARFDKALGAASGQLSVTLAALQRTVRDLATKPGVSQAERAQATVTAAAAARTAKAFAAAHAATPTDNGKKPVTLGVAEPFVATFTVAGYAALLLSLPFILYELYAFILPAFSPSERRVALPLMLLVPVLFITGVLFGYFVALPRAVTFLQNFNSDKFDIFIQAQVYYKFVVIFLALMGLIFQIPVAVLALTRAGIVNARILWQRQGYVILAISIVAAVATPTPDPITMIVTMLPLILLYELSIGLAFIFQPKGGTITGRWAEWWDERDTDSDDRAPAGATGDRAPVS